MKIKEITLSKKTIDYNDDNLIFKNDLILILDKKDYEQIKICSIENYFNLKFISYATLYQRWDDELERPIYPFIHVGYK